jgi:hypothetical protein
MLFAKHLRERVRKGQIRTTVRIWKRPHVKIRGRYAFEEGHIVVDAIRTISIDEITDELAVQSGFRDVEDLLKTAKHGTGDIVYVIRFHYVPEGVRDATRSARE